MKYKNIRGEGDYRYYKSLVFLTSAKGDWGGGGVGREGELDHPKSCYYWLN